MKIPIIINNRDLLTWPKAMVERIKKYDNVGDIIIIDNASTYPPLLEWYDTYPCIIIKQDNLGFAGAWDGGFIRALNPEYYVVTDSDMGLNDTPDNTLVYLKEKVDELKLGKVGLGLNWQVVKRECPYYNHMQDYELKRWLKTRVESDVALDVPIDTTFALYKENHYFIGGGSTFAPYIARHYPWEFTREEYASNEEFQYYIKNASDASSFKKYSRF